VSKINTGVKRRLAPYRNEWLEVSERVTAKTSNKIHGFADCGVRGDGRQTAPVSRSWVLPEKYS